MIFPSKSSVTSLSKSFNRHMGIGTPAQNDTVMLCFKTHVGEMTRQPLERAKSEQLLYNTPSKLQISIIEEGSGLH
jgi:hypothetical protein